MSTWHREVRFDPALLLASGLETVSVHASALVGGEQTMTMRGKADGACELGLDRTSVMP